MYYGRKKRYIIAAAVALPIIFAAFYIALQGGYKNTEDWNFDSYPANTSIPNVFASTDTGVLGGNGSWAIKSDQTAPSKPNVLARVSGDGTGTGYHLLLIARGSYDSFDASVKFMIISGKEDQTAGLVVRFEDINHYFVLRADAMNNKFSLCRIQIGAVVCTQDVDVSITKGQWHTITAQVAPPGIAGFLDGKRLLQRNDQNYSGGGQIGLLTKGDSNVYFDDLRINY